MENKIESMLKDLAYVFLKMCYYKERIILGEIYRRQNKKNWQIKIFDQNKLTMKEECRLWLTKQELMCYISEALQK